MCTICYTRASVHRSQNEVLDIREFENYFFCILLISGNYEVSKVSKVRKYICIYSCFVSLPQPVF